jgi:fucose 4-O-acetylase-like acetyltransferase
MNSVLRQAHAYLAWVFVGSVVVQVFLAGVAIPQLGGNGSFGDHRNFGYLIGLVTLLVLLAAIGARAGRRRILQAAGLLVLYVVQSSLPYMGPGLPFAAALHPVNALVMFWLGVVYARQVWRERTGPIAAVAAA